MAEQDSAQAATSVELTDADIRNLANRSTPEFDDVVLQADYAARAAISFYRFRQLGGGHGGIGQTKTITFGKASGKGAHYVSDHPQVRMLNLSVIALLVLFESAANAYFFAQQSELGISGGVFQAAAVSLANVSVSYFIIGYWGLRHAAIPFGFDFRRSVICLFGVLAILVGVVLVLLVNLSAAHYRNILDLRAENLLMSTDVVVTIPRFIISEDACRAILTSDMGQSIGSAATSAMCRPFALHSLDAMVLFALGMAISALAAFEGRRADAAYPGLSDAARQMERARADLQDALDEYYESYDDLIADAEKTLGAGRQLSPSQRIELKRRLDARAEPYRDLLSSDDQVLRDEFDVPIELVEKVAPRVNRAGSYWRRPAPVDRAGEASENGGAAPEAGRSEGSRGNE